MHSAKSFGPGDVVYHYSASTAFPLLTKVRVKAVRHNGVIVHKEKDLIGTFGGDTSVPYNSLRTELRPALFDLAFTLSRKATDMHLAAYHIEELTRDLYDLIGRSTPESTESLLDDRRKEEVKAMYKEKPS